MRVSHATAAIFILAVPLMLLAGLRPVGFDPDSRNYAALVGQNLGALAFGAREPTFWLINWFSNNAGFDAVRTFFLVYAVIGVGIKCTAIATFSSRVLLSLFLYLMLYFLPHEMTQIRAGVAAGVYLFALSALARGNRTSFLVRIFVAVCFHYSAIVGLVMLLFQRRVLTRKFLFLLPLAGIALALIFSPAMLELLGDWLLPAPIKGRLVLYLELLTDDRFSQINVLNPVTLSFLLVYWILVLKLPTTTGALDRLLLLSLGLGLASFYAFSVIPVMAFRVMEFLSVGIIILAANATLWWRDRQIWVSFVSCWAVAVFFTQSLVGALGLL